MTSTRSGYRTWLLAAGLLAAVAGVYAQTGRFDFVNYDDGEYVVENPVVLQGLTPANVAWAFDVYAANWFPLTWLSHMADVSLFGVRPGAHHLVNVLLHGLSVIALFAMLRAATGALWRSALAAALFAVHPLNVESVAWISERKNVLSTLFLILALHAYVAFARRGGALRYLLLLSLFALGLMSKPMLVTLPLLLVLLDVWPLGRLPGPVWPILKEKLPLFAMAAAAAVTAYVAQRSWEAVGATSVFTLAERLCNALVSSTRYLVAAVWPAGLACFYPHPVTIGEHVSRVAALASMAALVAISAYAWRARKSRPYVLVGWIWYLVTLAPVIGLVQIGSQSRADRYAYVPLIGIFVAVAWALGDAVAARPALRPGALAIVACVLVALGAVAWRQARVWRDSGVLYGHALRATRKNWLAANNLGTYLMARGENAEAFGPLRDSVRFKPDYADAHYNLGIVLTRLGSPREAVAEYRRSLELEPDNADGWVNLGGLELDFGHPAAAIDCYTRALALREDDTQALAGMVRAQLARGDGGGARATFARLESVSPKDAAELAATLTRAGGAR